MNVNEVKSAVNLLLVGEEFRSWLFRLLRKEYPNEFTLKSIRDLDPNERMSVEEMIIRCRYMESDCVELIHKTLNNLRIFTQYLVFDKPKLIKTYKLQDQKLINRIGTFQVEGENTLHKQVQLFYDCYKYLYQQKKKEAKKK